MKGILLRAVNFLLVFFIVGVVVATRTEAVNGTKQYMGADCFIISGDYLKEEIAYVRSIRNDSRYVFLQGGPDYCIQVLEEAIRLNRFVCTKLYLTSGGLQNYGCRMLC